MCFCESTIYCHVLALVIFEDCDLSVMTVTMVLWSLASLHFYLTCSHVMAERRTERLSQTLRILTHETCAISRTLAL